MNCTMRIIRLRELYYACSTIFLGKCAARPGGSSGTPPPTGALQGVRCVVGGRTEASAPTEGCKKCLCAGRCGHRPLRTHYWWCVGEGLCPSHGRGRTPPLRKRIMGCVGEGLCPSRGRPQGSPLRRHTRGAGVESPSHGFAVTAPFRQGGRGDGLPHQ